MRGPDGTFLPLLVWKFRFQWGCTSTEGHDKNPMEPGLRGRFDKCGGYRALAKELDVDYLGKAHYQAGCGGLSNLAENCDYVISAGALPPSHFPISFLLILFGGR